MEGEAQDLLQYQRDAAGLKTTGAYRAAVLFVSWVNAKRCRVDLVDICEPPFQCHRLGKRCYTLDYAQSCIFADLSCRQFRTKLSCIQHHGLSSLSWNETRIHRRGRKEYYIKIRRGYRAVYTAIHFNSWSSTPLFGRFHQLYRDST